MEHVIRPTHLGGMGYEPKDVILFGSSIGGGPATILANIYNSRCLIL